MCHCTLISTCQISNHYSQNRDCNDFLGIVLAFLGPSFQQCRAVTVLREARPLYDCLLQKARSCYQKGTKTERWHTEEKNWFCTKILDDFPERFECLRETFLMHLTIGEANTSSVIVSEVFDK